jgi:hypothetical protein
LDCIQCFVEQMLTHRAERENHMTKVSKLTQSKRSWRLILSTIYIHITACVCNVNKTAKKIQKKILCVSVWKVVSMVLGSEWFLYIALKNDLQISQFPKLNIENTLHTCMQYKWTWMYDRNDIYTNTCTHKYIENAYNKWTCMVWDVTLEIKIGQRRWHSLPKKKKNKTLQKGEYIFMGNRVFLEENKICNINS